MTANKDNWEKKFQKWKEEKKRLKIVEKPIEKIEKVVEDIEKETYNYLTEPKHVKILKIMVFLIPLIIIGYLIFSNFIVSQEFEYFYDIGSEEDNSLSPTDRISDKVIEENTNYVNLIGGLIYFNVPIARGAESVNIRIRFKDNFPEDWTMSLGAKDQEEWHYTYNKLYFDQLDLSKFNKMGEVYLINPDLALISFEELKQKSGVVVAVDKMYTPLTNIVTGYEEKETVIDTTLRGKHVFYIYASGDLEVNIKKQDINWYEGIDELEIALYDLNDVLIAKVTIEDDGIIEVDKSISKIQEKSFQVNELNKGIYRLEFSDFDGLIREIKINTNKIVTNRVFLADNELYNLETKESKLYFESSRTGQIRLITYHSAGIQNISYGEGKTFEFYQKDEPLHMDIEEGKYEIIFPKNDIIVSGIGYFAFSEENYFEPFKQKVVKIQNDMDWIKKNVDYLVIDYSKPIEDFGWLIAETEFNLEEDGLVVKDNKLSIVFNIPHLSNEEYANYTIPIDWIDITVHKPGVFDK